MSPREPGGQGRALTSDNPRRVAFDVLRAVSADDAYANLVLPKLLSQEHVEGRDAAFSTELAYGSLRMRGTLDRVIEVAARRELSTIDAPVLDALRLGAYQILCTRVPIHAAVDTTVSLTREAIGHKPAGFVNAVMRRISQRDSHAWMDALATGAQAADLALEYAHPEWIVAELDAALGTPGELRDALGANNIAPQVHLCARPGAIDAEDLADAVSGRVGEWSPYAVYLDGGDPGDIGAVADRRAHVQDEGSQVVASLLADAPVTGSDERWLDLCAGPGGKAALLGSLAALRAATVTAVEVSPHRADLVKSAVAGLPVEVVLADGRDPGFADDTFDRVLVDAPCTGLGALRRRPEARWRRKPEDVTELAVLQRQLLERALRLVRPGGVVAYVTCSPVIAETREVVEAVAGDRELIPVGPLLPSGMTGAEVGSCAQLWPHRHGTDAMFAALIRG
ncbi:RsmB/NOP family class I SAM-dependent RNA methyltransferase [Stackebrandtia soli]|uniref:RsmB/NOP family class I SAM-dependent RNA methyltransferase n=1 Tax=Stackebrandtia soli TaxID=1892856 RepID=UPI0039E86A1A